MKLNTVFAKICSLVILLLLITVITGVFLLVTDNTHQIARRVSALSASVTNTRSAYQIFFYERSEHNKKHLAEAMNNLDSAISENVAEENIPKEVEDLLHTFTQGVQKTEELLIERGLDEDSGLEGKFRKTVKDIEKKTKEAGIERLQIPLLQVRRHEKDFFSA